MSALSAEIYGERIQLSGGAKESAARQEGMVAARVKELQGEGVILLEAAGTVYRLRLDGARPARLRRGSKVLVREADLPARGVPEARRGVATAGAARRAARRSAAALAEALRGPWGELKLGEEMAALLSRPARGKGAAALKALRRSLLDADSAELAADLRRAVRDSGIFYEAKVAHAVATGKRIDGNGLATDLKHLLYALERAGEEELARAATGLEERILEHQLAAGEEELFYRRSAEIPYRDGESVRSMGLLWRRPRGTAAVGPYSVTLLLREGELGAVQVNLMADRGRLEVNISAAEQGACRRLAADAEELLGSLRDAGWQVNSVSVRQRELAGVDKQA